MLVMKGNQDKFGRKRLTKMTLKEDAVFDSLFRPFKYFAFVI